MLAGDVADRDGFVAVGQTPPRSTRVQGRLAVVAPLLAEEAVVAFGALVDGDVVSGRLGRDDDGLRSRGGGLSFANEAGPMPSDPARRPSFGSVKQARAGDRLGQLSHRIDMIYDASPLTDRRPCHSIRPVDRGEQGRADRTGRCRLDVVTSRWRRWPLSHWWPGRDGWRRVQRLVAGCWALVRARR
jgi:hypothetical protein